MLPATNNITTARTSGIYRWAKLSAITSDPTNVRHLLKCHDDTVTFGVLLLVYFDIAIDHGDNPITKLFTRRNQWRENDC